MSFAYSCDLQQALFAAFGADPELAELVGDRIYDEPPVPRPDAPHIELGDEEVEPWSTADGIGAAHAVRICVISSERGFGPLKRAAAAICAVALGPLTLAHGRVAFSSFLGGRTQRDADKGLRRIEMRFRIAVEAGDAT